MRQLLFILLLCSSAFSQPFAPQQKPMLGLPVNWAQPISHGLVGYWPFGENAGNKVFDLSGNGHNGTFISNPLWVPGSQGPALDFSDDAINIGDGIYDKCTSELTIIAKVRHDGGGNQYGRIIDKYPGPSLLADTVALVFRFYGIIGESRDEFWSDFNYVAGQTYVVAARLGSGFQELYVDGVLADPTLNGGPFAGTYDIGSGVNAYFGNRVSDMARDWDGLIEYIYIFSRALSASEINLLYREPFCMFKPSWDWMLFGAISVPAAGGQVIIISN